MVFLKRLNLGQKLVLGYLALCLIFFFVWKVSGIAWPIATLAFIGFVVVILVTTFGHQSSRERYAEARADEEKEAESTPPTSPKGKLRGPDFRVTSGIAGNEPLRFEDDERQRIYSQKGGNR